MRNIYKLINSTKGECYIGTTKGEVEDRFEEHKDGGTKAISHWDFGKDNITCKKLHDSSQFNDEDAAIKKAHELEKSCGCLDTGGK